MDKCITESVQTGRTNTLKTQWARYPPTMIQESVGRVAEDDRLPDSARAVASYYAKTGVFDYRSLLLKRRVDDVVDEMLGELFADIERAIAEEFGYDDVTFSYDTKLVLPAKLTLAYLYRETDDTEHRRAEELTRVVVEALIDGDMRDAINDSEFEDFEVDVAIDERARLAELAQSRTEARLQRQLDSFPDSVRDIYDWAVGISTGHQDRDEFFRELMADVQRGGTDPERIAAEYRDVPFDDPPDLFTETERSLPYIKTQYDRVGILYDAMLTAYRDVGLSIAPSFKRAMVLTIIGAQIWLDDIEDFEEDLQSGQLTPVTAEYLLADETGTPREAVVDIGQQYLDRAQQEATAVDSALTGIAIEYIRRSGQPESLPPAVEVRWSNADSDGETAVTPDSDRRSSPARPTQTEPETARGSGITGSIASLLRRATEMVNLGSLGGRILLGLDTNPVPDDWTHISKVDPEGEKQLPLAFPLYLSETSAVSVGGSQDVTPENTDETVEIIAASGVPMLHEPSGADHVMTERTGERTDYLAVPEVLNGDSEAIVGRLGRGLNYVREEFAPAMFERKFGVQLDPDGPVGERVGNFAAAYLMRKAIFEAYIIMNTDSAAAREAGVTEADLLSPTAARGRALAAEYHLDSEVVYLEYSGTFGGDEAVEILEAIDDAVSYPRLWYGGGLDSAERTEQVLDGGADAVVVGNVFHDIVDAEGELVARARDRFDDTPDYGELTEWVGESVDVGETSATRYLSTVPGVDDAEQRATAYLAAGVELALVIDAIADELDPGTGSVSRKLREHDRLAETALATSHRDGRDLSRRIAATLLAERLDFDADDAFAAKHFSVELPT